MHPDEDLTAKIPDDFQISQIFRNQANLITNTTAAFSEKKPESHGKSATVAFSEQKPESHSETDQ